MPPEHVDVLVVGAGVSGIGAAHHLQERFPDKSFLLLEAQDAPGGTWWTHRYPGVRSDSDLFTYGYRFKPWRGPSIAAGGEILNYLDEVIAEDDLTRHIRYHHRVSAAEWSTEDRRWTVSRHPARHRGGAPVHHRVPLDVPGLLQPRPAPPAGVAGHGPLPGPGRAPPAVARRPGPHREARRRRRLRLHRRDADPRHRRAGGPRHHAAALARRTSWRRRSPTSSPSRCGRWTSRTSGRTRSSAAPTPPSSTSWRGWRTRRRTSCTTSSWSP